MFYLVRQPKVDQCSLGAESVLTSGGRPPESFTILAGRKNSPPKIGLFPKKAFFFGLTPHKQEDKGILLFGK